jgi:protoheme IX farnesyltransferase
VHLLFADAIWVALVLTSLAAADPDLIATDRVPVGSVEEGAKHPAGVMVRAYLQLTKPRVISLLLFTTLAAMVIAGGGWPGAWLFAAVALGGYMAAGAANAINMVVDRDIDARMARTSRRPTVTHLIPWGKALAFGLAMAAGSFALLWVAANLLTAVLALSGLLFYVFVYTLLLKRRTWHNIVIGGAAGAFPPLVGWAAVTNELNAFAWCLFALIFVWTPVHFWALAIFIKDDYASAGVPMLPVVRGERATVVQIAVYAVLTALVSLLPVLQPHVGSLYLGSAVLLNAALFAVCFSLLRKPERPQAFKVFKFSMAYLAALFLILALDRVVTA